MKNGKLNVIITLPLSAVDSSLRFILDSINFILQFINHKLFKRFTYSQFWSKAVPSRCWEKVASNGSLFKYYERSFVIKILTLLSLCFSLCFKTFSVLFPRSLNFRNFPAKLVQLINQIPPGKYRVSLRQFRRSLFSHNRSQNFNL